MLVDSEPIANRVFARALAELDLHLTDEQMFDYFLGRSMDHCMSVGAKLLGRAPPDDFLSDLQRRTFAAFATELHATPGIEYALDRLRPLLRRIEW